MTRTTPARLGRTRRRLTAAGATVLIASATALAGCAGNPGGDGQSGGDVTLNFAWWGDASRADRYEKAIDLYEDRNPNVTIRTGYAGFSDYWTARNTEAASRSLPDVFQMDLAYLSEYASFGHVAPLDEYVGDVITTDTVEASLLESGVVDEQLYGIPSSSSAWAAYVNAPLLEELGIDVPEAPFTWDEYDDFLAEVADAGATSSPAVYGSIDYTQYFWGFQVWLGQQGKSLIEGEALGFDEADLAEWWGRSAELQEAGGLPPERLTQLEGVDPLGAAETASDMSWDNFLPRFSEGPAAPELTLLAPPSDDPARTGLFLKPGLQLSIGANSDHPAEAAAFIDFLVNDPEVGAIFGMSRGVPASSEARDGVEAGPLDEQILAYEESIAENLDGEAPPAVQGLSTLEQTFVTISQDVAYGSVSVDEAVERWFTEAENALN